MGWALHNNTKQHRLSKSNGYKKGNTSTASKLAKPYVCIKINNNQLYLPTHVVDTQRTMRKNESG